jgi:hypothetical protein
MQKLNKLENSRASSSFDVSKKLPKVNSLTETGLQPNKLKVHQYSNYSGFSKNGEFHPTYVDRTILTKSPSVIEVSLL